MKLSDKIINQVKREYDRRVIFRAFHFLTLKESGKLCIIRYRLGFTWVLAYTVDGSATINFCYFLFPSSLRRKAESLVKENT